MYKAEPIVAGELIWWQGDEKYNDIDISRDVLMSWPADKRDQWLSLAYMVDENTWRGSDPDKKIPLSEQYEYYVNHSCDGNAWYNGETELVAMYDISTGDEICYDYALTECDPTYQLNCLCGKSKCRGVVTGSDWKRSDLQQKYGHHFTTHITKLIDAEKQIQPSSSST